MTPALDRNALEPVHSHQTSHPIGTAALAHCLWRARSEAYCANPQMITRWERKLTESGSKAFGGQGKARDEEMASLKRELGRVKKERGFVARSGNVFCERPEVKYHVVDR